MTKLDKLREKHSREHTGFIWSCNRRLSNEHKSCKELWKQLKEREQEGEKQWTKNLHTSTQS